MEKIIHLTDLENLPLSSNQVRLWIIYQQDKLDPTYNLQLAFHLEGAVDIEILRQSMNILKFMEACQASGFDNLFIPLIITTNHKGCKVPVYC